MSFSLYQWVETTRFALADQRVSILSYRVPYVRGIVSVFTANGYKN